jgi:hypothetical protein
LFKVNKMGKNIIHSANGPKPRGLVREYKKHAPRFFIIHKDSSGTEMLRYEDVCEYLAEAEADPMTAIIRDCVQGYPNIIGTTILKPISSKLLFFSTTTSLINIKTCRLIFYFMSILINNHTRLSHRPVAKRVRREGDCAAGLALSQPDLVSTETRSQSARAKVRHEFGPRSSRRGECKQSS